MRQFKGGGERGTAPPPKPAEVGSGVDDGY
jgi:hypothetical protein